VVRPRVGSLPSCQLGPLPCFLGTSILNRPRRGRAVLISDALRTSRPKWFGVRPYPVCERRKKNQNLRRGPVKPKRGADLTRLGVGWSQLRAPGPQNRSGGRKKNLFWGALVPLSGLCTAGTDPGRCRDRMAARLHFGFFSTAGSRRDAASCKIRHLGTKTIDIIYQSFLSAPVALGAALLATLKGLVVAAMPGLTSGLKLPLKTTKS
jgi:hypothetical protein